MLDIYKRAEKVIIFDGRALAKTGEVNLQKSLAKGKREFPRLVSILSADNKESLLYTSLKQKAAERVGIPFEAISLPSNLRTLNYIGNLISRLNSDSSVGGLLIQLPFFGNKDDLKVTSLIAPTKDVDCLTPFNLGLIQLGQPNILPATVRAILEILTYANPNSETLQLDKPARRLGEPARRLGGFDQYRSHLAWLAGPNIVLGSRGMVGAPLTTILSHLGATVTGCHRQTQNLKEICLKADVIISCAGSPGLVKKDMVKSGVIVIDVGTSVVNGRVVGDIDQSVAEVASFITPVPGGVGPLTVVSLLKNFLNLVF